MKEDEALTVAMMMTGMAGVTAKLKGADPDCKSCWFSPRVGTTGLDINCGGWPEVCRSCIRNGYLNPDGTRGPRWKKTWFGWRLRKE